MSRNIRTFELQLLGWKKSTHRSGPEITLRLQNDEDIEYFEAFTVAKGKTAGQIFDAAFSISDQDDQHQEKISTVKKHDGQLLSNYAAMLCKDENFQRYVAEQCEIDECNEKCCRDYICGNCFITSRSRLDTDHDASQRFHEDIRIPYKEWREHHGI